MLPGSKSRKRVPKRILKKKWPPQCLSGKNPERMARGISSSDKWEKEPRAAKPKADGRAMELHKEGEPISRKPGNKDELQRSPGNHALIHRDLGEIDRAMELHKEGEPISRKPGE